MIDYEQYFEWPGVQLYHFYIYFIFAAVIALYLIIKSKSKYKIELFFISFYLLTGNTNDLLTIKIPGFSFFEIDIQAELAAGSMRKNITVLLQEMSHDDRADLFNYLDGNIANKLL